MPSFSFLKIVSHSCIVPQETLQSEQTKTSRTVTSVCFNSYSFRISPPFPQRLANINLL